MQIKIKNLKLLIQINKNIMFYLIYGEKERILKNKILIVFNFLPTFNDYNHMNFY